MPNAEKVEKVAALKSRIEGANALLLAEYRGLSVHDATELRRSLSETARFSVVKNTLMQRAAGDAGIEELGSLLSGPTAVAFVEGDVISAAKKVVDAAKRFPSLVLKGAYLDGKVLDAKEAQALATLESREAMLSRIAGLMKSEMSRAASMFQALQGRFLGLLEAYKEKLPGAEAAPVESLAEPEPEVADEPVVEPELEAGDDTVAEPEVADEAASDEPSVEETSEVEASAGNEEE